MTTRPYKGLGEHHVTFLSFGALVLSLEGMKLNTSNLLSGLIVSEFYCRHDGVP